MSRGHVGCQKGVWACPIWPALPRGHQCHSCMERNGNVPAHQPACGECREAIAVGEYELTVSKERLLTQASEPSVRVMRSARAGLQKASQRRGVTPLVLFWNLWGQRSTKSRKMLSFRMLVCRAATPFTVWLATSARYAIRTYLQAIPGAFEARR